MQQRIAKPLIFIVAATVTSVLFINFCNLVYQCGCESLWAGAAEHCNIHDAESRHCPWCSMGNAGAFGVWGTIVAAQGAVAFGLRTGMVVRTALAVLTFPLVGGVLAALIGWAQGYWSSEH
jgi:hypothetical protein